MGWLPVESKTGVAGRFFTTDLSILILKYENNLSTLKLSVIMKITFIIINSLLYPLLVNLKNPLQYRNTALL